MTSVSRTNKQAKFWDTDVVKVKDQPRKGLKKNLSKLDKFCFTTPERKFQMHCSEFHEWLTQFNTHQNDKYCPYCLVPDPQYFLNCASPGHSIDTFGGRFPWLALHDVVTKVFVMSPGWLEDGGGLSEALPSGDLHSAKLLSCPRGTWLVILMGSPYSTGITVCLKGSPLGQSYSPVLLRDLSA